MSMLGKLAAIFSLALLSTPVHPGEFPQLLQAPDDEFQKRPKRAFVGTTVKEYAFARYLENWVAKVERVGNANYPEAARREGIYGSLKLTVSIYADGSIEAIEIDRSSGSEVLDAAAIRIVELAAPFAPFSDEMRQKIDILSITRTWTFVRSDQAAAAD